MSVVIFDSGSGGLSILRDCLALRPDLDYLFYADTLGFPYGGRTADFVISRCIECIHSLDTDKISAIIVACNTASTVVLPKLREYYQCPVIGVVPAIKTASEKTKTGAFSVIATPATAKRPYTMELVKQFAADKEVFLLATPNLVHIAETFIASGSCDLKKLRLELDPLTELTHHDALVLGCTHYPLLKNEILKLLPPNFRFLIDSGGAIARRLDSLMGKPTFKRGKILVEASASNSVYTAIQVFVEELSLNRIRI